MRGLSGTKTTRWKRSGFYLFSKASQLVGFGNFEPRIELDKPLETLTANGVSVELVGLQVFRGRVQVLFVIGYGLSL